MTNKRTTKRALLTGIMALFLCFTMLLGTTYAWFTDSVSSGKNTIYAGNLDIELDYYDGSQWKTVKDATTLFKQDTLWEPGHTEVVYLRLTNKGTLSLRYQMGVEVLSEVTSINVDNQPLKLSDIIEFGVVADVNGETDEYATGADAIGAVTNSAPLSAGYTRSGHMPGKTNTEVTEYMALVVYMPTTVGNAANYKTGAAVPSIDLGINVLATQTPAESDSFGINYDEFAAVDTVAEANALMKNGEDVYLIGANEVNSVLEIPADYAGTLALGNVKVKSIQAAKDAKIVIVGNVTVDANGDGVATAAATQGTSAITANGALTITGNGGLLTAIANGYHAYGIGGDATTAITLENLHIANVKGGYVQPDFINDPEYGKGEPEGGAAIGSGVSGAVITLNSVTIDNAQGGSKAAGIGAKFWTGVTININNSIIKNVEGGNASAGIGGSRVNSSIKPADQHVKINITKSVINATGGQFGAGIGSGYDTYCGLTSDGMSAHITETICTINIDADSDITAKGGKYAAGVGTGYHVAALAGNIECAVNATAGESRDKYTIAQAVGFGVVDHTREVSCLTTAPSITYQGTVITVPPTQTSGQDALDAAIEAGEANIVLAAGTYTIPSAVAGKAITIEGSGDSTVIDFTKVNTVSDASITFKNLKLQGKNENVMNGFGIQHTTGDIVYENCTFDGAVTNEYYGTVTYKNCTFTGTGYITTYAVKSATFESCVFDKADSRAVLVYSHGDNPVVVTLTDCTFSADAIGKTGAGDWTAAVEVDTTNIKTAGTTVSITNCTHDEMYSGIVRDKSAANATPAEIIINGKQCVVTASALKSALASGATEINIAGNITLTESLSANNVTLIGMGDGAGIHFNGKNITGSGDSTITYKNLNLTTVSLPYIPENGERYGWYGGIDYAGHSVANYENCTISGVFTAYSKTVNVTGCTFNPYIQDGEEFYHIFVYGSAEVNVKDSTFYYGDRAIKIYNEGGTKDIAFHIENSDFKAAEGATVNKALINIDSTYLNSVTLTITNITIDEALNGVAVHNGDGNEKVSVTIS